MLTKTLLSCLVVCFLATAIQAQIRSAAPYCDGEYQTNYNMIDSMKFESFNQNFGRMGGFTTPNNFIYFSTTTLPNITVGATATLKL